jgi:hypothetical protein
MTYDYDLEKSTHNSISKNLSFAKEKRFGSIGIFGDVFDDNKSKRFGSIFEGLYDLDKAESAKVTFLRPRIVE